MLTCILGMQRCCSDVTARLVERLCVVLGRLLLTDCHVHEIMQ